jgi:hypothetical protein
MPFDTLDSDLTIIPVGSKAELKRFIKLANRLNAKDPNWVVPLMYERMAALTPKTNPFFEHADVQMWLAVRGGRDVGRISAQIDHLATEEGDGQDRQFRHDRRRGRSGDLHPAVPHRRGLAEGPRLHPALGPFNLSINEEVGLLVDGFDTKPMVMMGHDPATPPRGSRSRATSRPRTSTPMSAIPAPPCRAVVVRRVKRGLPEGVTLRELDMSRYDEEVKALTEILNDAWSGNWGFVPTTEAETAQLGKSLKDVLDKRLILFSEIDGEPAGFIVLLPNVNEAIEGLNGKLLPFGWAKLLWRLKVKRVKSIRIPLMGLKRKFADTLRGQVVPFHLMNAGRDAGLALGYDKFEFSWILEDNAPMRRISEAMGAEIYKTYRIYEKAL